MGFFDVLQSAAVSMVVAGNNGIAPFLTLFLVGCIEKNNPDLLTMSSTMENVVASWPGLIFLGTLTILEIVAKCVPVLDQIVDSVMLFIVPCTSVIGTLSTFGLFGHLAGDDEGRRLSVASGALVFLQIVLVCVGVCLAVSLHLFKMLVRLMGIGCLNCVFTIAEIGFCVSTVTIAIFAKEIAIIIAALLFIAAGYTIKKKFIDKKDSTEGEEGRHVSRQVEGDVVDVGYQATDDKGDIPTAIATPVV